MLSSARQAPIGAQRTSEQRAPSRGTTASSGATLGLPRTISSPMAGPARRSADTACQAAAAAATATDRDVLCYGWPNPRRLIRNAIPTLSAGTAGTPASVRASNAETTDGPLTARVRDRAALARPAPSIFLLSQFLQTVQHYTPLQAWLRTLPWTEGVIDIREARADDEDDPDDPKTESGDRTIALDALTIAILRTWCKRQAEERLAWGGAWTDTGLVFTREDGTALPPQWVSARFEALAYRSGLPPSASTTCGMVPPACAKPPGRTRKSSATCSVTTGQASPMTCTSTSFPMSSKRRPRREQPAYQTAEG